MTPRRIKFLKAWGSWLGMVSLCLAISTGGFYLYIWAVEVLTISMDLMWFLFTVAVVLAGTAFLAWADTE